MRQHTVRKRRLDRTREQAAADHRRDARAAISFHKTDRGLAGQKGHARDHGCDGVEHMVLALLDHVVGQRALACLAHIRAERRHDRAHRGGAPRRAGAEPGGRDRTPALSTPRRVSVRRWDGELLCPLRSRAMSVLPGSRH